MLSFRAFLCGAALCCAAILSGCGIGPITTTTGGGTSDLQGMVHGGQQPISGATIKLYTVGNSGNGSTATPMLTQAVTSQLDGSFVLTGKYTCGQSSTGAAINSPSNQVYLVAQGGNPGLPSGTNNTAIVMMAALGSCGNLTPTTFIFVDEVTTAAAAWALTPFMGANANIGASATNVSGIENAFLDAGLLANTTSGNAATLPSNLSIESGKLYALANAIGGCVNSDGTTGCSQLFAAATVNGTAPQDTLTATVNIVKNPGKNVLAVWQSIPTSTAYPMTLTQSPNDWTMSLTVTGGGLYGPTQLAVDTVGNVWVANYFGSVSAFSPQGNALSPAATAGAPTSGGFGNGTLSGIYGLAVDTNDNVFVTNELQGSNGSYGNVGSISIVNGVTSGNTLGSLVTNMGSGGGSGTAYFYDSTIQYPESLAIDSNGNILIGNDNGAAASYVTVYNSSGSEVAAGLGIPFGSEVFGVSADQAHGAWLANAGDLTVTHTDASGGVISNSSCCNEAVGVATDAQGNAWVANYGMSAGGQSTVSEIAPGCDTNTTRRSSLCAGAGGNVLLLNQLPVAGLYHPQGIFVDAGQNIWLANFHALPGAAGAAIVEIAGSVNPLGAGTAISPAMGYGLDAGLVEPFSLAPDPSGDVWVADEGSSHVVMFFGLATPTAAAVGPTPAMP